MDLANSLVLSGIVGSGALLSGIIRLSGLLAGLGGEIGGDGARLIGLSLPNLERKNCKIYLGWI